MAGRGRPRSFDRAHALRRAMEVFWQRGYEGTSLADLTDALGINKPSLYAAFGCKEALFREAIDLYNLTQSPLSGGDPFATETTTRDAIETMLRAHARIYADPGTPPGCMVVLAATIGTPDTAPVRAHLRNLRRQSQDNLRDRIAHCLARDGLGDATDAARIAAFYTTVLQGLSIQARDGASVADLERIIDDAIAAWDHLVPRQQAHANSG